MLKLSKTLLSSTIAVAALAALAACGGGGGGGGVTPNPGGGGGNGGGGGTPPPSTPPPASASGQMMLAGAPMSNAQIIFTCGCSPQAGTVNADGNGNYTLPLSANAVPASPTPTYTAVPGRNYLVVGAAAAPSKAEAWTMVFYGNTPSHNLYLSPNNVTDEYTAAAALFVYYNSENAADTSFDRWNFNSIANFANSLRTTRNSAEQKLVDDIHAAQVSGQTLFVNPTSGGVPTWDPHRPTANSTIKSDLIAVGTSGDAAIPTPCPSTGCTGAPTP